MNSRCQNQRLAHALTSHAIPQLASAAPTGSLPATATPPELERGEVAVVIDQAGLIVAAEPICAALFQWEPAELVGQPLEVLLTAGTENLRQQLVPDRTAPGLEGEACRRLFALAQRKDGTSFPVAVRLELVAPNASCWWTVAFHDVSSPPVAPPEHREAGSLPPLPVLPRDRAQVTAPLVLEAIPDIFLRAPAEPEPPPELSTPVDPAAAESSALPSGEEPSPEPLAAEAPPAPPAPADSDAGLQEPEPPAQAQPQPSPAPSSAQREEEPPLQDQLLELENRLRIAISSLARTTAELETERGERRRSEQRAATLAAQMQQLHEELKTHLESEQSDRERLAQLEHALHEQNQQNDLTIAKLQSALQLEQCERKRLEAELLRSRFLSTDSARAGRAQVNGLRRQLQPSVENLHQSACHLLQFQLAEEQKQLVQAMLEHILLLQTSLQESPES